MLMRLCTVGFSGKSARVFFELLREAGIQRLVDIRLHNTNQLAGFTKKDDLAYFLHALCGIAYLHEPLLAPTEEMLREVRKAGRRGWAVYERDFVRLLSERNLDERLPDLLLSVPTVMLCSEPTAEHCHRRLVAEYLAERVPGVEIVHL